jgi:hypothetical protein
MAKKPNRWLFSIGRLWRGHHPVFLEYAVDLSPRWTKPEGNRHLKPIFAAAEPGLIETVAEFAELEAVVAALCDGTLDGLRFDWNNGHLPALDALSVMWAAKRAKSTFLEIGSGNSTIAARAAIRHFGLDTRIVSIDPQPRADIDGLCDEVIRAPVEATDLSRMADLEPGDVLFIDSSHRSFMNSDVTVEFLEILPALRPGVLVGVHDICLPYDYPERWTKRAYNEQYLLGAMLLANPGYFDIRVANFWATDRGLFDNALPGVWKRIGGDLRNRGGSAFLGIKT